MAAPDPNTLLAMLEALRITEANLSSLIAARHESRTIMEPWHRMVKATIERATRGEPEVPRDSLWQPNTAQEQPSGWVLR